MEDRQPRPAKKRSRQQRRTSATRAKLVQAARAVFAEKGMDLTRIDEIAERSDVGKGTFYYHFSGKPQLVKEVIRAVMSELGAAVEQKCKGDSSLHDLLNHLIAAHVEFFGKRWEDFVLYFQGRSDLTLAEGYPGIETPYIQYLECVEGLLEPVIKYRLTPAVLRRIACAIAGFVSGYYSFAAISSADENIDEVFLSLQGAIVVSLERFIREAAPPVGVGDRTMDK